MAELPRFDRALFDPERRLSRLGGGAVGGKARGLIEAQGVLASHAGELEPFRTQGVEVDIPALVVLGTDLFDAFLHRNGLSDLVLRDSPTDEAIAHAFQRATLPEEFAGDLMSLATEARVPLAVRSSSALEDALGQPFAGVYGTKMIPGNQVEATARFKALVEAVKFVWATTHFAAARAYREAAGRGEGDEKMAVVVQEVVGRRHRDRFYPDLSGVARSYNFYPTGPARAADGVVHLAAGLGKTIVDGGLCWSFSPAHPRAVPPVASPRELLGRTQSRLWAVHVGPPPPWDPTSETEHLVEIDLATAEADGALARLASTYDPRSDRFTPGLGRSGPRLLDFAPLLVWEELPLVGLLRRLLAVCEETLGAPVEIEFALTLHTRRPARFGFLQVRPLLVSGTEVALADEELARDDAVVASRTALGNGSREVSDVVYVVPEGYEARHNPAIVGELETLNRRLLAEGRHALLIGFGRWGSSDPWLGIPVRWDQISAARVIVEATLPSHTPDPSQGSHFFHNLASFEVAYFGVPHGQGRIDWAWLAAQPLIAATEHVRHVRPACPLRVRVDGRTSRGLVQREEP